MKIFCFLLIIFLVSCGSVGDQNEADFQNIVDQEKHDENTGYPDDTYCARVEYNNSNTGTESSYTLTVLVQNNEVIEINWPNGGTLDQDHFQAAELDEYGHTKFTNDKGYEYSIDITGKSTNCFANTSPVRQCLGQTKNGNRCRHMTDNGSQLCWQHEDKVN